MKKNLLSALMMLSVMLGGIAAADARDCLLCGSGSSNGCQQCDAGGTDSKARSACEKAGCKISGTGSCSTAANVKICKASNFQVPGDDTLDPVMWCAPSQAYSL